MASRRPPLFELLQHEDGPRQGPGSGVGRPNALGHAKDRPAEAKNGTGNGNGQAQGAVETKPSQGQADRSAATTLEDLSEPATQPASRPEPKQPQAKPKTTHVPAPMPEPAPAAKPVAAKSEPKAERTSGAADWSGMHPKTNVQVPMLWVYCGVAVVIFVVAVVWGVGYKLGVNNEKAELERYWERTGQSGTIADPMTTGEESEATEPPPLAGVDRQQEERRQAEQTPRVEPTPPVVQRTPEPVQIDVLGDVRQPGNNYLKWASGMTRERAVGLAQHLATNGVHAMAIDEGRRGFGLYTALAVPSGQFSAMESQRRELEAKVIRLLGSAPQEAGGAYSPRDQIWMRFDG